MNIRPFKKLDDELHFWTGMIISFLTFFVCDITGIDKVISIIVSFTVACLAGIGKEYYDKEIKKTRFDWRDIKFTVIGGIIIPLLLTIVEITYYFSKP
jgi:hypothetical protein